jgi:hypothetical protein
MVWRKRARICVFDSNRHRNGNSVFCKRDSDQIRGGFIEIPRRHFLAFVCYRYFLCILISLLVLLLLHRQTSPKLGEFPGHQNQGYSETGFQAKWYQKAQLFVLDSQCLRHLFDCRKRILQHSLNELLFNAVQRTKCDFRQSFVDSWADEFVCSVVAGIGPKKNRKIRSVYSYIWSFDHLKICTLLSSPKMSRLPLGITRCIAL